MLFAKGITVESSIIMKEEKILTLENIKLLYNPSYAVFLLPEDKANRKHKPSIKHIHYPVVPKMTLQLPMTFYNAMSYFFKTETEEIAGRKLNLQPESLLGTNDPYGR